MKHVMDRRALVKSAAGVCVAGTVATSGIAGIISGPHMRYILISEKSDARTESFIAEIGAFIGQRDPNWVSGLERLTLANDLQAIETLINRFGPQTEVVEWPIIAAISKEHRAGDEIEIWSHEWLTHAKDLIDGCYPVSGGWWSVEGDWNPTAAKVRKHLFESPNHTEGHFTQEWLNLLNRSELQSIHSDHHREMTGQGKVHWVHVNAECPAT